MIFFAVNSFLLEVTLRNHIIPWGFYSRMMYHSRKLEICLRLIRIATRFRSLISAVRRAKFSLSYLCQKWSSFLFWDKNINFSCVKTLRKQYIGSHFVWYCCLIKPVESPKQFSVWIARFRSVARWAAYWARPNEYYRGAMVDLYSSDKSFCCGKIFFLHYRKALVKTTK